MSICTATTLAGRTDADIAERIKAGRARGKSRRWSPAPWAA